MIRVNKEHNHDDYYVAYIHLKSAIYGLAVLRKRFIALTTRYWIESIECESYPPHLSF